MKEAVQTAKYFANEYRRERQYEEAKRAVRQALAKDEQVSMRVEELAAQERDSEKKDIKRLEEEEADRERE